jgi:hypothetical protein
MDFYSQTGESSLWSWPPTTSGMTLLLSGPGLPVPGGGSADSGGFVKPRNRLETIL